jgi:hypothetical protein
MAFEDLGDYSVGAAGSDTFDVVIPDLDPGRIVPIQFRWKFADGSYGLWSASKNLSTPEISRPEASNITSAWNGINLEISWEAPLLSTLFTIYITSGAVTVPFAYSIDKTKPQQKAIISSQELINNFAGVLPTTLTGLLKTVYIDTSTTGTAFAIPPYADAISGQNISDSDWSVLSVSNGFTVSWAGALVSSPTYNYTEVYTSSSQSGTYDLVYSGKGPAIITVASLSTNYIKIKHVSITGLKSSFSVVKEAVPFDPIVFDSTPPVNTFNVGTTTVTDDSNGLFSFDKKVLFTWTENADAGTSGYRIRFRIAGSGSVYTYMSVPGKDKTSSYLYGLKGGKSYEVAVSTFDIYGNTNETQWQTYPNIVVPVSNSLLPDVAITAGDMKLGYGISSDNSKKGLYIAPDNYWYVQGNTNVSSAAYLSVGGATDKLVWDGTSLSVTGTINANAGNFTGAIQVGSATAYGQFKLNTPTGTKIEMGAFTNAQGAYTGGVGIQGTDAGGTLFQLDTSSGITVNKGTIGGWSITANSITKANTSLGSDGSITAGAAGQFTVTAAGGLTATSADITGVIKASSGYLGNTTSGWQINSETITSKAGSTNGVITLNSNTGTISGGLITGTKVTGTTIEGGTVTGATINLSGTQIASSNVSGVQTESSDNSTRLNFTGARYTVIPATQTTTEYTSIPTYDPVNDEWGSTTGTNTIVSNTVKFTDSLFEGSVPDSAFYYGETWYSSGTTGGTVINYVNYLGGYMGFELRANSTEKGFYFIGDSSIAGQNWGVAHYTTSSKDQPAMLQTDATGKVTRGRAIFTSGSSSTVILGSTWNSVGQNGDLAFSTNN